MFSCLHILEAFLWFVLITLLNVTLIIFFFQAEDGIRDWSVTVQTCALPIWERRVERDLHFNRRVIVDSQETPSAMRLPAWPNARASSTCSRSHVQAAASESGRGSQTTPRSEERRVGQEGGYRWTRDA